VSAAWRAVTCNTTTGVFVAVAAGPSNIAATSPDGITWTQQTLPTTANWFGVAFSSAMQIYVATAGGNTGQSNIAASSIDGITWTQRTLPTTAYWVGVTGF
jgi:hypothetical protein